MGTWLRRLPTGAVEIFSRGKRQFEMAEYSLIQTAAPFVDRVCNVPSVVVNERKHLTFFHVRALGLQEERAIHNASSVDYQMPKTGQVLHAPAATATDQSTVPTTQRRCQPLSIPRSLDDAGMVSDGDRSVAP